ncbi:MAG: hypothetical protein WAX04_06575 [Oscillospiraceae bacterium]
MTTLKIQINLIQNTNIVNTYYTINREDARRIYENNTNSKYQYTQLIIGERAYTTAEAERYFGIRDIGSQQTCLGKREMYK